MNAFSLIHQTMKSHKNITASLSFSLTFSATKHSTNKIFPKKKKEKKSTKHKTQKDKHFTFLFPHFLSNQT
jgi:hypothetical protein